jgi:phage baseplate assembly protein W
VAVEKVKYFGSDLRLLRNLDQQNSRERGSDLQIQRRLRTGKMDLEPVAEIDNIKQALLLRFLTPVGELEPLGHPDYGCRLIELIGELNVERTRNRAKMFVLQSLDAEPRIKEVLRVDVQPNISDRNRIDIAVDAITVDTSTPLNLVFPFFLDGGPAA